MGWTWTGVSAERKGTSRSVHVRLTGKETDAELEALAVSMVRALDAEARRSERDVVPDACGACGSEDLLPIVYGVAFEAMRRAQAEGRIVLGGPDPARGAPTVQCRACGRRSGEAEG